MAEETLFILEEPSISELLLSTLENNQFLVLKNDVAKRFSDRHLNFIEEKDIIKNNNYKIYSNSENSIDLVLKKFSQTELSRLINICKDKYIFRQNLKSVYPDFYFDKITLDNIDKYSPKIEKFIIKPSVGFLSMGVHKVNNKDEWNTTKTLIKNEIKDFKKNFPESVLNSSEFIIEEIIEGEEFAVDTYFDNTGKPVILNIFSHPFVSEDDVSDRAYITSKEIIENNFEPFENILLKIGSALNIKDFPIHIEMIKKQNGDIIPVEINPMRFAGWCTTDLAYYAYGINIYEYFCFNKKPDWDKILKDKNDEIYYFAMAETPTNIDKSKIRFNYNTLKTEFSHILDFREINYIEKPLFAMIFGKTKSQNEITKILNLNMKDFIEYN